MKNIRKLVYLILIIAINIVSSSCVKTHYTTQSKASSYNDYKAAKYNMKNKKKKKR